MADISNKTLGILVGVALVVSVLGLFNITNPFFLTGAGTTGRVSVYITENIALNVTTNTSSFGKGVVYQGVPNCTMSTESLNDYPANCWNGTITTGGFEAKNVGNRFLNVTLTSTRTNASDFFGYTKKNTIARYFLKCSGNGTIILTTYGVVNKTARKCVGNLNITAQTNAFRVNINITIPATAVGPKNDTVTFTATKA